MNAEDAEMRNAAKDGQVELMKQLASKGVGIDIGNRYGTRPIHTAAQGGQRASIEFLVEKGADINAATRAGDTALHMSSQGGFLNVVEYILSKGVDVGLKTSSGWTALHYASNENRLEIAKLLMQKGADPNAPDETGKTPLSLAKEAMKPLLESTKSLPKEPKQDIAQAVQVEEKKFEEPARTTQPPSLISQPSSANLTQSLPSQNISQQQQPPPVRQPTVALPPLSIPNSGGGTESMVQLMIMQLQELRALRQEITELKELMSSAAQNALPPTLQISHGNNTAVYKYDTLIKKL